MLRRRCLPGLLAGLAWIGSASAQQTSGYPNRPIRFIVPFAAGGSTSHVVRLVAAKLAESWGQQVLVENRGGANTVIGTEALARSAPDGYTISLVTSAFATLPHLMATLPYDSAKDFVPVATLATTQLVLLLHPSVPANNLKEFIALAKSRPGVLNYATVGSGGSSHLAGELFQGAAGVKMQHVPYKGSANAMTDLIGGQVQVSFDAPATATQHIRAAKLKAIAITGRSRLLTLPDVPTFAEAGLPEYDFQIWYGALAPAGTPRDIVDKLSSEIGRILSLPDVKENLVANGLASYVLPSDQFVALIKSDATRYGKIIKAAGIKIE